jgi:hypothetical protein
MESKRQPKERDKLDETLDQLNQVESALQKAFERLSLEKESQKKAQEEKILQQSAPVARIKKKHHEHSGMPSSTGVWTCCGKPVVIFCGSSQNEEDEGCTQLAGLFSKKALV